MTRFPAAAVLPAAIGFALFTAASIDTAAAQTQAEAPDQLAQTQTSQTQASQNATPAVTGATVLDRIVISAGAKKVAIDTPQSLSVVDQEDIDAEQATTVGDVMTDLPGVKAVGSDRVLGESFNIRGIGTLSSSDEYRLIVTVDGAQKFHEQYRMGSLFTDPELYKRIEVLRGPASSTLYGSGALAGTINLTTKDASDFLKNGESFAFREKLDFHDNRDGFTTSSIAASRPAENVELLGSFNYRHAGSYDDGNGDKVADTAFDAPSGLVKGRMTLGADRSHALRASYQHWTTQSNGAAYSQTGTVDAFGRVDRKVVDQTAVLGYAYTPANPLIDLDATLSYSKSLVEQRNATVASTSDLYADADYAFEFVQASVRNSMEFSGESFRNVLIAGGEAIFQTRTADNLRDADGKVTFHPGGESQRYGVFVQNEWIYRDRLTLIPGVRIDRQHLEPDSKVTVTGEKVAHTAVSPKLAAHYKLDDVWGVFGSVAYTERMPVLDEIYDNSSSNVDLTPETSINYETGLSMSLADVLSRRDALAAKGTVFFNRIDNLIERQSTTAPFRNSGESQIMGLEIEASYNAERAFARAAFSLIRGSNKASGEALNSIPADEFVLTLGGRIPSEHVEYGWRGVFADAQNHVSGTTQATGGYVVHDLFASWKPEQGTLAGAEFRFGIDNVFDQQYREHLAGDPGKGRTFKLTVAKTF